MLYKANSHCCLSFYDDSSECSAALILKNRQVTKWALKVTKYCKKVTSVVKIYKGKVVKPLKPETCWDSLYHGTTQPNVKYLCRTKFYFKGGKYLLLVGRGICVLRLNKSCKTMVQVLDFLK